MYIGKSEVHERVVKSTYFHVYMLKVNNDNNTSEIWHTTPSSIKLRRVWTMVT